MDTKSDVNKTLFAIINVKQDILNFLTSFSFIINVSNNEQNLNENTSIFANYFQVSLFFDFLLN